MLEAYQEYWVRYTDFSGKTSRSGYWYVVLVTFLFNLVIGRLFPGVIQLAWTVANLLPGIAIALRRLRSAGKNPMHYLWTFTGIGAFWVIYLLVQPDQD